MHIIEHPLVSKADFNMTPNKDTTPREMATLMYGAI
jgi:hypothetical protein